jgi:hypothetical protein
MICFRLGLDINLRAVTSSPRRCNAFLHCCAHHRLLASHHYFLISFSWTEENRDSFRVVTPVVTAGREERGERRLCDKLSCFANQNIQYVCVEAAGAPRWLHMRVCRGGEQCSQEESIVHHVR